jgi:hypothetical protein
MTNVWDFKFILVTSVHQCAILSKDDVCLQSHGGCIICPWWEGCSPGDQSGVTWSCTSATVLNIFPSFSPAYVHSQNSFCPDWYLKPKALALARHIIFQDGLRMHWHRNHGQKLMAQPFSRLRASWTASSLESNNPHLRLLNLCVWVMNPHPQPHTPMSCLVAVTKLNMIHDTRRMCCCILESAFLIIGYVGLPPAGTLKDSAYCPHSVCVCVNFTLLIYSNADSILHCQEIS